MEFVKLSTKGRVVIPASIRAALGLKAGTCFNVSVEDKTIVLKPVAAMVWKPVNPADALLSTEELTRPVDLKLLARP